MELPVELYLEIIQYSSHIWRLFRQTNRFWATKLLTTASLHVVSRVMSRLGSYEAMSWNRPAPTRKLEYYWASFHDGRFSVSRRVYCPGRQFEITITMRRYGDMRVMVYADDSRLLYYDGLVMDSYTPTFLNPPFIPDLARDLLHGVQ